MFQRQVGTVTSGYALYTASKHCQTREVFALKTFENAACCMMLLALLCGVPICAQQKSSSSSAESCRRFVQEFYTWYAARSIKAGGVDLILAKRRASFSPELVRRLKEDRLAAKR